MGGPLYLLVIAVCWYGLDEQSALVASAILLFINHSFWRVGDGILGLLKRLENEPHERLVSRLVGDFTVLIVELVLTALGAYMGWRFKQEFGVVHIF
jgi:hypothetical protein